MTAVTQRHNNRMIEAEMHHTMMPDEVETARREADNRRSREYRARRRGGEMVVSLIVQPSDRHALERLGLLPAGSRDPYEVGCAVAQFLAAAPGVVMLGEGLYPARDNAG